MSTPETGTPAAGLLTVEESADVIRKSRTWTWNAVRSGELKSFKIGNRRLVAREDLDMFIRRAQAGS